MTQLSRAATAFSASLFLFAAVAPAAVTCSEPTFSRYRLYPVAGELRSVETADLNRDGRLDVMSAGNDANVTVRLAGSNGELIAETTYPIGAPVQSLRSGDVTGDNLVDLVVGANTYVVILPGDGTGGFGTPRVVAVEAREVAVGQFDFDAPLEAVAAGATTTTLLHSDANGTTTQTLPIGGGWLLDGEFSGDGLRDIALGKVGSLQVWVNTGGAAFSPFGTPFPTDSYNSGGTSDLNGDGIDEMLVHFGGGFRGFRISGGTLVQIFELWSANAFAVEDMDADGRLDVVLSHIYDFSVAYQSPSGEFAAPAIIPAPFGRYILKRADLDGDGTSDWIMGGSSSLMTLPGRLIEPVVPYAFHVGEGIALQIGMEDLDHDGDLDAIVPMSMTDVPGANGYLAVLLYDSSSGRFADEIRYEIPGNAGSFDLADLNGDGEVDLITGGMITGDSALFFGNGAGGFAAAAVTPSLIYGTPESHDVDQDGDLDVILSDISGQFAVIKNGGAGSFAAPLVETNAGRAVPMSVNGDSFIDLVGVKTTGITVYANDGNGVFSPSTVSNFAIPSVNVARAGDLDDDGDPDIVVTSYESPSVTLIENLGDGVFALRSGPSPMGKSAIELGDVSGDGLTDMIVMGTDGYDVGRIYINRGSWKFGEAQPVVGNRGVHEAHIADVNADGRTDVVMMNHHGHVLFSEQRCNSVEVDAAIGSTAITGYERIRIRGRGFKPGAKAYFDGASVPVVYVDSMNVEAISSPGLDAGTMADVKVVNLDDESSTLADELFVHFLDVERTSGLFPFVERLVKAHVTGGCGGGNFCPGASVTRAQAAVFIEAAKQGAAFVPPPATGVFLDVPPSHFAAAWIEQLARDGITGGCGGGNFCPSSPVTRGQASVLLLAARNGAGYQPPAATGIFTDVPASAPFAPWIEQLAREGVTAGCGQNQFCPDQPATRGAMAVFISKMLLP